MKGQPGIDEDLRRAEGKSSALSGFVNSAYRLLYYATEQGIEIPEDVRSIIVQSKAHLDAGAIMTAAEETLFLHGYQVLNRLTQPVSADSLHDTDDALGQAGIVRRGLRMETRSAGKQFATKFALLAILLLAIILLLEFGQTFARNIFVNRDEAVKLSDEQRTLLVSLQAVDRQLAKTSGSDSSILESLQRQRADIEAQLDRVQLRLRNVMAAMNHGYRLLAGIVLPRNIPPDPQLHALLIAPIAGSIGGYVLPLSYGALGACAFILRSVVSQLHDRSFSRTRVGDYGARVYLGMLSGIAIQWIFAGEGKQIPGGFTPAVLAFAGGYSVEIIFSVLDRIIHTVTGTIKPKETDSEKTPRLYRDVSADRELRRSDRSRTGQGDEGGQR